MDFSDLKPDQSAADARWEELRPKVLILLQAINEQVFDGGWSTEYSRPHIPGNLPKVPRDRHLLLAPSKRKERFICVCLEVDGVNLRVVTHSGNSRIFRNRRDVVPEVLVDVLRAEVKQLLYSLGG